MIRPILAALTCWILLSLEAEAHLSPNSVLSLDFESRAVRAEILMPAGELAYAEGRSLALDGALSGQRPFLERYIGEHLRLAAPDGRPWTTRIDDLALREDGGGADIVAMVTLTPPSGAPLRRFTLAWDGVIDRIDNHYVLVFARSDFAGGVLSNAPELIGGLQGSRKTMAVDRGGANTWRGFIASLRLGMAHIAEGHDHLLFLIAIMLPAPLRADGRRWAAFSGWRGMLVKLALVASAFTVGHSLTLIGAALLGWRLPAPPVEVAIALSILVSAIHAWRPLFAGREAFVAASFGLVHGLAFATVIGDFRLEPWSRAQAILGFNLGIELVQLAVLAGLLPLLLLLAPTPRYTPLRVAGAMLAGAAALAWLVERLSGNANAVAGALEAVFARAPLWLLLATLGALALRAWDSRGIRPG